MIAATAISIANRRRAELRNWFVGWAPSVPTACAAVSGWWARNVPAPTSNPSLPTRAATRGVRGVLRRASQWLANAPHHPLEGEGFKAKQPSKLDSTYLRRTVHPQPAAGHPPVTCRARTAGAALTRSRVESHRDGGGLTPHPLPVRWRSCKPTNGGGSWCCNLRVPVLPFLIVPAPIHVVRIPIRRASPGSAARWCSTSCC